MTATLDVAGAASAVASEQPAVVSGGPVPSAPGRRWPRVVGRLRGAEPGPTLLCVAGLHGNEPAGLLGVERVFERLAASGLRRGEFVGLAGNLEGLAAGRRYVDEDLNRMWLERRLGAARSGAAGSTEEHELAELERELRAVVAAARGEIYVIDLHTISGPGPPFVVLDDTRLNRHFANRFPVPMVFGLEEELVGTMSHYLTAEGMIPIGFEAGQHEDPESADRSEAAVWIGLRAAGLLDDGAAEHTAARHRLLRDSKGLPVVVEVRYRHPVAPGDEFEIEPGLASFTRVRRGQQLARDRNGPVLAPESGLLLMPLYQPQGEDGFFLTREVWPFWLRLSEWVRPLKLERFLHWLPGVRKHPEVEHAFIVDRRIARFEALQLFHLLGFRRRGAADRYLVMARRRQGRG